MAWIIMKHSNTNCKKWIIAIGAVVVIFTHSVSHTANMFL